MDGQTDGWMDGQVDGQTAMAISLYPPPNGSANRILCYFEIEEKDFSIICFHQATYGRKSFRKKQDVFVKHECPHNGHLFENCDLDI